jgi:hypothetical protein
MRKRFYSGEIAGLSIKKMDCLTEINLTTEIGDRETPILGKFFNFIKEPLLPKLKVVSVSNKFSCPIVFEDIMTRAVNLTSLTLHEGIVFPV